MSERRRYRVCWAASSNVTFRGKARWEDLDPDDDPATIEDEALEAALDRSGFECWVEWEDEMSDD